jgi:ribosomal protein S21
LRIEVIGNDVGRALKKLDKKLKEAGLFGTLKAQSEARSKSEKRRLKHLRALRRHRRRDQKLAAFREGLVVQENPTNLHPRRT